MNNVLEVGKLYTLRDDVNKKSLIKFRGFKIKVISVKKRTFDFKNGSKGNYITSYTCNIYNQYNEVVLDKNGSIKNFVISPREILETGMKPKPSKLKSQRKYVCKEGYKLRCVSTYLPEETNMLSPDSTLLDTIRSSDPRMSKTKSKSKTRSKSKTKSKIYTSVKFGLKSKRMKSKRMKSKRMKSKRR